MCNYSMVLYFKSVRCNGISMTVCVVFLFCLRTHLPVENVPQPIRYLMVSDRKLDLLFTFMRKGHFLDVFSYLPDNDEILGKMINMLNRLFFFSKLNIFVYLGRLVSLTFRFQDTPMYLNINYCYQILIPLT